ncbi:MAG: CDP-diacylglycerol--glycerol-3-phosphate 3-phosphatidyltransferase [Nitrospiria bacterium]
MDKTGAPNTPGQSISSATHTGGMGLLNLPNLLTSLRIFLIPVFLLLFLTPSPIRSQWAALIFLIASATDLLDGYMARKMEQITRLGKLLDPIADKLLVISALILLVEFHRVPAILAILLIGREMAITGLRVIATDHGIVIPVERLGKYKTFLQVVAITLLILDSSFLSPLSSLGRGIDPHDWGRILLWGSLILALISAGQYFYRFSKQIQRRN